MRNKLKAYLAPKFRAANGGELPDEENPDAYSADDYATDFADNAPVPEEQLPLDEEAAPIATDVETDPDHSPSAAASTPPATDARDPAKLRDYLQSRYDKASDSSDIKAARASADKKNMIANIGDALNTIVTAGGVAHGAPRDDGSFFKGLKDQNNLKVADAQTDRKAALDGWAQKLAVDDHVAKQVAVQGTADQKAAALKTIKDNNDGASNSSQQKLKLFNQFNPDHALPEGTSGVTVDAAAKYAAAGDSIALKKLMVEAKIESSKAGVGTRQEGLDLRATNNANIRIDKNQTLKNGFNRMDKVNSAKGLMEKIQSGELTDTESVASQLTNMITSIEMGAAGGVGDREHVAVKGLQMQLSKLSNYFGKPVSAIPPEVLSQINNEINTLGHETAKNMRGAHRSLVAGTNNKTEQDAINNRMNTYFEENGYGESGTQKGSHQETAPIPKTPQLVKVQAPDGSVKSVPKASIDKYLKKGGKIVQ